MSLRSSLSLLRVPYFAPVAAAILLTILSEAVAGSYMVLFAVERIGMSPLELSAYLTLSALAGMAISMVLGSRHDRRPTLWPVQLSLAAKGIGFVLCVFITEPWMLIAVGFVLLSLGAAAFSLLFAIAKGHLDLAGGDAPAGGMAALRMTSSLGWAIGPALGALLVFLWGFDGVYLGATLLAALAAAAVFFGRIAPVAAPPRQVRVTMDVIRAAAPAVLALTAFNTAMFMGGNAMSIVVAHELGTETDVGLLYSLCAAIEVVIMGAFVLRPGLSHSRPLLLVGFAFFAAFFVLVMVLPTLPSFYFGQLLRAAAIGIVSIVGMAVLQQMLPGRAGVAAALYGNTIGAGALLAGLGTGLFANAFGYMALFAVCAVLSVAGGLALLVRTRPVVTDR